MNNHAYNLYDIGFIEFFSNQMERFPENNELLPGRIIKENHNIFSVLTEKGEITARPDGKLNSRIRNYEEEKPVVGDWVLMKSADDQSAVINFILNRFSSLYRNAAGLKTEKQLLAANIDYIFIVSGLDNDLNLRRLERYLTIAWESGAQPVIILNKSDLIDPDHIQGIISKIRKLSPDVNVLLISALKNIGLGQLNDYLVTGKTSALIGSSGCGKSTLINALIGNEVQTVKEVRESDSRGRHTTVGRELFILPGGGIVIDNPGLREIQLYAEPDSLERTFSDIESLAGKCKFKDCSHLTEPGCAVQKALLDGELDPDRFSGYLKLQNELDYFENRRNSRKYQNEKRIAKFSKELKKHGQNFGKW